MPDRADHLAKTLLSRAETLERHLREDGIAEDTSQAVERRLEMIGKLLAIEVGVVDGIIDRTVLRLMPTVRPGQPISEGERKEFASELRARLPLSSEER